MATNTEIDFIGIQQLMQLNIAQFEKFNQWMVAEDWVSFHSNHYDWWAFPIDKPSNYGFAYTVYDEDIAQMKNDEEFMRKHQLGAAYLLLSWGWDAKTNQTVSNPDIAQSWADWPIRLAKCARSMWLFDQSKQFESCLEYAQYLQGSGTSFGYNGRDLFNEIVNPQNY